MSRFSIAGVEVISIIFAHSFVADCLFEFVMVSLGPVAWRNECLILSPLRREPAARQSVLSTYRGGTNEPHTQTPA